MQSQFYILNQCSGKGYKNRRLKSSLKSVKNITEPNMKQFSLESCVNRIYIHETLSYSNFESGVVFIFR